MAICKQLERAFLPLTASGMAESMTLMSNDPRLENILSAIRDVPDFPKPGIIFKDIAPVLGDPERFSETLSLMEERIAPHQPTKIAGIDARGFIFGAALADRLDIGFIPVRKKGKLPWETIGKAYTLEYGEAEIEIHRDAAGEGDRVVLVDDLLATGGTAGAACELIESTGAKVPLISFFIELSFLDGRSKLPAGILVDALIKY